MTCVMFGKGDRITANHFPSFGFIYECNLISYIAFILFADTYTERVKVTK